MTPLRHSGVPHAVEYRNVLAPQEADFVVGRIGRVGSGLVLVLMMTMLWASSLSRLWRLL